MWKCLVIFVAATALAQQPPPFPYRHRVTQDLAEYLNLTEQQSEQLSRNSVGHENSLAEAQNEILRLNDEIGKETQKPDPSAALLGPLYVRIEDLCRAGQLPRSNLYQRQMLVLTEQQRARLAVLEGLALAEGLYLEGQYRFLIPTQAGSLSGVFNGTSTVYESLFYYYRLVGRTPAIAAEFIEYLQLSAGQVGAIESRLTQHSAASLALLDRMNRANSDQEQEAARASPVASSLGRSYRELEVLRREIATRETELLEENIRLLNPDQHRKLAALKTRPDLHDIYHDTVRLTMLRPVVRLPASREAYPFPRSTGPDGRERDPFENVGVIIVFDLVAEPRPFKSIYRVCLYGPEYIVQTPPSNTSNTVNTATRRAIRAVR